MARVLAAFDGMWPPTFSISITHISDPLGRANTVPDSTYLKKKGLDISKKKGLEIPVVKGLGTPKSVKHAYPSCHITTPMSTSCILQHAAAACMHTCMHAYVHTCRMLPLPLVPPPLPLPLPLPHRACMRAFIHACKLLLQNACCVLHAACQHTCLYTCQNIC